MKKITTFLGCVGVVCLFSGCSSEDDLGKIITPSAPVAEVVPSSDSKAPASSGNSTANSSAVLNSSSNTAPQSGSSAMSSGAAVPDTVHKQVVIKSSASSYPDPYFSSGIFCWTAECETKWAGVTSSSAAPKSSSSMTIDIGMSVETPVEPTINGNTLIDNRDNQSYPLQKGGSALWMASNMKYKTKNGTYCTEQDGKDVCDTYGMFYTYAAAQSACPYGWRLPTQAEVEAMRETVDFEWWAIGGRFEISDNGASSQYGQAEEQGRLWVIAENSVNSVRIENYSGNKFVFENASATERAFNVRCIKSN